VAYNTNKIKTDADGRPIPQYFNPVTDNYEVLQGANGANRVELYGPDGNPISSTGGKLAVRASEIETQLTAIQGHVKTLEDKLTEIAAGTSPITAQLSGSKGKVSASFARPDNTTAYGAGDVVGTDPATNLTFLDMGVAGEELIILGARVLVKKETAALSLPPGCSKFKLHLYSAAPTALVDNVAFALPYVDGDKYVGCITFSTPIDKGDVLFSQDDGINMPVNLASPNLYGILETVGAYTPTAKVVKVIELHYAAL
jgi:hypothetical protein